MGVSSTQGLNNFRVIAGTSAWTVSATYLGTTERPISYGDYSHDMQGSVTFVMPPSGLVEIECQVLPVSGTYPMYAGGWRITQAHGGGSSSRMANTLNQGGQWESGGTVLNQFYGTPGTTYTLVCVCASNSYASALPAGATVQVHVVCIVRG